ncbi:MAG: GGDEF domain-containing protein, partial [Mesorhizobium sp.]
VVLGQGATAHGGRTDDVVSLMDYLYRKMTIVLGLVLSWRQQVVELRRSALTDPLTGLANRTGFWAGFDHDSSAGHHDVGLLYVDLDHFKTVNDTHGHDVGDDVLKAVAGCLRDMTRYHDVAARLGGEEFAVVAPNMDVDQLRKFAERIRKGIAGLQVFSGDVRLNITTSVGLAVWDKRESAEDFFRRADRHLYQAKRLGRNRVCA